jgi:hypothetical protein
MNDFAGSLRDPRHEPPARANHDLVLPDLRPARRLTVGGDATPPDQHGGDPVGSAPYWPEQVPHPEPDNLQTAT